MSTLYQKERNRAREYYNPLRGLDISRLVRLLEASERGRNADLQRLYRMMEKRYYVLLTLKSRRLGAIKKLNWSIKVPDELPKGFTEAQAEAQADLLRSAYEQIVNLPQAVEHLALATFRGYAHLEKHYVDDKPSLGICRLQPVPQEHFFRDQQTWAWRYDPEARDQDSGSTPIEDGDFILREVADPINEIAVLCGLRANMSKKDWDAFCEDYGLPSVFFSLSENTPTEKVKEWLAIAEQVTGNSRGALPPGGTVTPIDLASDGIQFEKHMLWQEREVVLAGTGGLLTMIAASGTGTLAGGAHQEAFDLLAIAEAMEVSAILQEQFDQPLLAQEFPGQPVLAYFELAAEDTEDLDKLADRLAKLKNAGFDADEAEVSEKFGLKLKRSATPVAFGAPDANQPPDANGAKPPFANRATAEAQANAGSEARYLAGAQNLLRSAELIALQPLIERTAALAAVIDDDAAFEAGYRKLMADLPALEAQCLGDKASAPLEKAFDEILGGAMAGAISNAAETRGRNEKQLPVPSKPGSAPHFKP